MKNNFILSCFFFLLFFSFSPISAQYKFHRSFEKLNFWSGIQCNDDGFAAAGIANGLGFGNDDIFLLKLNPFGETEWLKIYGGPNRDWGQMIKQTNDGGFVIVGTTWSFNLPVDIYVIRTNADGDTLWTRAYGTTMSDYGYAIVQTSDDGFVISGFTSPSLGTDDVYLLKLDAIGNLMWAKTYGGTRMEQCNDVIQTNDGGYALTGFTDSYGITTEGDVFIIKTDSLGNIQWTKTYGGSDEENGQDIIQTSDGGYLVGGGTFSFGAGDFDGYLLKTDSSGDLIWSKTYGRDLEDWIVSLSKAGDNNYIITGGSRTFNGSVATFDSYSMKLNSSGDTIWTRYYGDSLKNDIAVGIRHTTDDGFAIFTGYEYGNNNVKSYVIKVDKNGYTDCPTTSIGFSVATAPTQVKDSTWMEGIAGIEKTIPTLIKDTMVADSLYCEKCGEIRINYNEILCLGEKSQVSITSSVNADFQWQPLNGLSCSNCPDPIASPDTTSWYYFDAIDEFGCQSTDSILIRVDSCELEIIIPNIFSPDEDGRNDQFEIKGIGLEGWTLHIINRWGELVYHTNIPATKFWKGRTFSGREVSGGTYFYVLENQALKFYQTGYVQLVR